MRALGPLSPDFRNRSNSEPAREAIVQRSYHRLLVFVALAIRNRQFRRLQLGSPRPLRRRQNSRRGENHFRPVPACHGYFCSPPRRRRRRIGGGPQASACTCWRLSCSYGRSSPPGKNGRLSPLPGNDPIMFSVGGHTLTSATPSIRPICSSGWDASWRLRHSLWSLCSYLSRCDLYGRGAREERNFLRSSMRDEYEAFRNATGFFWPKFRLARRQLSPCRRDRNAARTASPRIARRASRSCCPRRFSSSDRASCRARHCRRPPPPPRRLSPSP
jgi:hypothetical protein